MGVRLLVCAAEGQAIEDGPSYAFDQTRVVIGRGAGADVRIPHLTVSERHAVLLPRGTGYAIEDSGSTNGTRVNGTRLTPQRGRALQDGDRIQIGAYELSFHGGVLVTEAITAERTAELARRLFRSSQRGASIGQPRLVVVAGADTGRSLKIPPPPSRLLLGRAEHCQLRLADGEVADEHLEIIRDLEGTLLRDLSSGQGSRRLRDGDEFAVGECRLLFEEPAEEPLQALSGQPDEPQPTPPTVAQSSSDAQDEPAKTEVLAVEPKEKARGGSLDADLIIYALAAIVMAVSVAGLLLLMGD